MYIIQQGGSRWDWDHTPIGTVREQRGGRRRRLRGRPLGCPSPPASPAVSHPAPASILHVPRASLLAVCVDLGVRGCGLHRGSGRAPVLCHSQAGGCARHGAGLAVQRTSARVLLLPLRVEVWGWLVGSGLRLSDAPPLPSYHVTSLHITRQVAEDLKLEEEQAAARAAAEAALRDPEVAARLEGACVRVCSCLAQGGLLPGAHACLHAPSWPTQIELPTHPRTTLCRRARRLDQRCAGRCRPAVLWLRVPGHGEGNLDFQLRGVLHHGSRHHGWRAHSRPRRPGLRAQPSWHAAAPAGGCGQGRRQRADAHQQRRLPAHAAPRRGARRGRPARARRPSTGPATVPAEPSMVCAHARR